jgi:hypothetical protein
MSIDTAIDTSDLSIQTTTISQPEIPMYKTDKGFNIGVNALARDASDNIDKVRLITVPAAVMRRRVNRREFEAPTLSEVGGGARNSFCQVVAGSDGRPVPVDEVHRINTDPTRANINHGTASISIGSYFAVGWTMHSDKVILIFEVLESSEYRPAGRSEKDAQEKPLSKLTCTLVGHEITNWKSRVLEVPPHLSALMQATRDRLRNDADIPFYMDVMRMVKPDEAHHQLALNAAANEFGEANERDQEFMTKVMQEIVDIRFSQYEMLAPDTKPKERRVPAAKIVETLTLDEYGNIDITVTPIRPDDVPQTTFRVRLNRSNFADEHGKQLLERSMVLNCTSYDALKIELEKRTHKHKVVITNLTSLR